MVRVVHVALALLALTVASLMAPFQARADAGQSQVASDCPQYGGWLLYRVPDGGSGGIRSLYTRNQGECVAFFAQHPDAEFVGVTLPNPRPR